MYLRVLFIALLIPFLLLVLLFWPVRRQWLMLRKLPGPPGLPLIGNALQLQGTLNHTFALVNKWSLDYGNLFKFWLGPKVAIFVSDPAIAQLILSNPKNLNRDRLFEGALGYFLGNGLLTSRDEEWRIHRKLLAPLFYYQVLRSYIEIFGRKSQLLVEKLSDIADGRNINIYYHVSCCALDALCESVMGVEMDSLTDGQNEFNKATVRGCDLTVDRIVSPWLQLKWMYPLFAEGREGAAVSKCVNEFTEDIITTKLQDYRSGKRQKPVGGKGEDEVGRREVSSILDLIIEASENEGAVLSPQDIRDELKTLLVAGHDTATIALSTFFVLLGIFPEVQDKVSRELDEIFGNDPRQATADDLASMVYLGRALKESQRLSPSGHFYPRELTEDVQLPCGRVLPYGATAFVFVYRLHRDERSFPEPERFLPDRWLPERTADVHPFAFLPYSAGPRNCLGQGYAKLLMKVIVSSVLRRFTITTRLKVEDLKVVDVGVIAHLTNGNYEIQLRKRARPQYNDNFGRNIA